MKYFAIILVFLNSSLAQADDADKAGREYAWKTFKESFPPELSKSYCFQKRREWFNELVGESNHYLESEFLTRGLFFAYEKYYYARKKQYDLCTKYVRMTKQGNLLESRVTRQEIAAAMKRLEWSFVPIRISFNEKRPLSEIEYANKKLKGDMAVFRTVLSQHNK